MIKIVEMRNISKRFNNHFALNNVRFDLYDSEIHCLLGENGAGKSTLMKILYGLIPMDDGEILIDSKKVFLRSPKDAIRNHIGMVSQHFSLVPTLTVAENITLGKIPKKYSMFIDRYSERRKVERLEDEIGFQLDPTKRVEDLSVGEQQKVEILKVLYHDARILILDEPTAVLTPQEITDLFNILKLLKKKGCSIILIVHKLNETTISDRLSVLRNGELVFSRKAEGIAHNDLANFMFGVKEKQAQVSIKCNRGEAVFEIQNLTTHGVGANALKNLSLSVCEGQIVGIAGVSGNGQSTLVKIIMGLHNVKNGKILLSGKEITNSSTKMRRQLKIACIPEDRIHEGILQNMSVEQNLILGYEDSDRFSSLGFLKKSAIVSFGNIAISDFKIKASSVKASIQSLSGGNIQKVILSRELMSDPVFILASQPTRGLDANTIDFIHQMLKNERNRGKAILLISYDLDEILELSDTLLVLYNGEAKLITQDNFNVDYIGKAMVGYH